LGACQLNLTRLNLTRSLLLIF